MFSVSLVVDHASTVRHTFGVSMHAYCKIRIGATHVSSGIEHGTIATLNVRTVLMDCTLSVYRSCIVPVLHILPSLYESTQRVGLCIRGCSARSHAHDAIDQHWCR
jgi:hypothetical protein